MTSPIAEISAPVPDSFAQSKPGLPEKMERGQKVEPHAANQPEGDSVTLSIQAKSRLLKERGASPSEIAKLLNVDEKTVERLLGVVPVPLSAQARLLKEEGESVSQIAERLGVDVKSVKRYLGVPAVPAATEAQQLMHQGVSPDEIASRLGLDDMTVNLYLGITSSHAKDGERHSD